LGHQSGVDGGLHARKDDANLPPHVEETKTPQNHPPTHTGEQQRLNNDLIVTSTPPQENIHSEVTDKAGAEAGVKNDPSDTSGASDALRSNDGDTNTRLFHHQVIGDRGGEGLEQHVGHLKPTKSHIGRWWSCVATAATSFFFQLSCMSQLKDYLYQIYPPLPTAFRAVREFAVHTDDFVIDMTNVVVQDGSFHFYNLSDKEGE